MKKWKPAVSMRVDHGPAFAGPFGRPLDLGVPVGQRALEDLAVQRLLGREMVEEARPADADPFGDVVERGTVVAVFGEAAKGFRQDGTSS